jgi:hypothetical protein
LYSKNEEKKELSFLLIEDWAFTPSLDLPPPLFSQQVVTLFQSSCASLPVKLTSGVRVGVTAKS